MNIGGTERFNITFKNNANGEWDLFNKSSDSSDTVVDFSKIPSALNNQPTLKEFIDADRAIYLGGSSSSGNSSSGGIGDLPEIIASSNFDSKIPDIILLHPTGETNDPRCYRFFGIDQSEGVILYRINASDKQISFKIILENLPFKIRW